MDINFLVVIAKHPILSIENSKDFLERKKSIYEYFWTIFAPNNDIAIYRDYLIEIPIFARNKASQEVIAGYFWEYLMNDISARELDTIMNMRKKRH